MAKDHQSFTDELKEGRTKHGPWEKEAREMYQFFSLAQWSEADATKLREEERPGLTFDRTRPIVQAVLGSQITQRYQANFLPRETEIARPDRVISEDCTEVGRAVQDKGNFEQIETLAFQDNLVTGVGAMQMYVDFDRNPDGEILLRRKPVGSCIWDPTSVEPNMMDMGWVISTSWVDKDEAEQLYGKEATEAAVKASGEEGTTTYIQDSGRNSYSIFASSDVPTFDKRRNKVRLYERECFTRHYQTRILSPDVESPEFMMAIQGGAPMPQLDQLVDKKNAQARVMELTQQIDSINASLGRPMVEPPFTIENFPVRVYYRTIHTDHEKIYEEVMKNPFTILFITCFEDWSDPDFRQFFGLVKPMKDPQQYANKFLSQALHIFLANPKGVLMAEPNLFDNIAKAGEQWAKSTGFIVTKEGALSNSPAPKWVHISSQPSLTNIESLLSYAMQAVPAAVGISESSFLGTSGDIRRVSGEAVNSLLQQQQKTQVLPFDSLRLYRKQMGRLLLSMMEQYLSEETATKILGTPDPAFLESLKAGTLSEEYDVIVEEAPVSPNERQQIMSDLVESQFLSQLMSAGIPIPPELADFFKIPSKAAQQFKQSLQMAYDVQNLSMQMQLRDLQTRMQLPPGSPLPGEMPPEPVPGEAPPEGVPPEGAAPPPPPIAEGVQ
jgi:hypothetical protein